VDFHEICSWLILEVIRNIFRMSEVCQSVVSAATLRLLGSAQNVATVHVRGCTGTTVTILTYFTYTRAPTARRGNDTVPIQRGVADVFHTLVCGVCQAPIWTYWRCHATVSTRRLTSSSGDSRDDAITLILSSKSDAGAPTTRSDADT